MTSTASAPAARVNGYAAKCSRCGGWVPAREGVLGGSRAAGWTTTHAGTCPAPRAAAAPKVNAAPGYYVRADGAAIKVIQSKRSADRTYGKIFTPRAGTRPTWEYVPGAGYSVSDLTPMTAADAAALGLSHGYCIRCCAPLGGETLSAAVSALIGYGETCAHREGWPYPKGVAAQRARLAEG